MAGASAGSSTAGASAGSSTAGSGTGSSGSVATSGNPSQGGSGKPGAGYSCPAPAGTKKMVSTAADLQTAMKGAQAGDVITLAPGMYAGAAMTVPITGGSSPVNFHSVAMGTAQAPITLTSADPSNPAVLVGTDTAVGSGYVLHLAATSYWHVQNLVVTKGSKGIMFDQVTNSYICGVEVYGTGDEAIHLRDASSNNVVEGVNVHDTGKAQPDYSEGFYTGSFTGTAYNPASNDNILKKSHFGPNIQSKYVNLQPGSAGNVVDGCDFDGTGAGGANSGYSFLSIKGDASKPSVVMNNTFNRAGNAVITSAVAVSYNAADIHDNTFNLDDASSATCFKIFGGGSASPKNDKRNPASSSDKCP
jgi:hypothetical protein